MATAETTRLAEPRPLPAPPVPTLDDLERLSIAERLAAFAAARHIQPTQGGV